MDMPNICRDSPFYGALRLAGDRVGWGFITRL